MVHQHNIVGVVEARPLPKKTKLCQLIFYILVSILTEKDLLCLLIHREVTRPKVRFTLFILNWVLLLQGWNYLVNLDIEVGITFRWSGDDQRGTCLIDKD